MSQTIHVDEETVAVEPAAVADAVPSDAAVRPPPESVAIVEADDETNVFSMLAHQARDRRALALWTTAIGGTIDAAVVWSNYRGLHWLAAGFAAVAAYGIWGLADRAMNRLELEGRRFVIPRGALFVIRTAVIPIGVIAAIGAVGGFMAAALGGWQH